MTETTRSTARTYIAKVDGIEFKRTTVRQDRHYTHAVIVRQGTTLGVWGFCNSLQLAQRQLAQAQRAWAREIADGTAQAFIVPVTERR